MIIPQPGGQIIRVCKLDTGSTVDVISQAVVSDLRMKVKPYNGPDIKPIGKDIQPIGEITLDWHVYEKSKTYTTNFLVLDEEMSQDFDVLLGSKTIGRIGFYDKNEQIWFIR